MHKLARLMEDIARASVSAVVGLFMLGKGQTKNRFRQSGKCRQGKKKSVRKGGKERVKQTGGKRDGCNKQREGGDSEMDARPDLPGREEKEAT